MLLVQEIWNIFEQAPNRETLFIFPLTLTMLCFLVDRYREKKDGRRL